MKDDALLADLLRVSPSGLPELLQIRVPEAAKLVEKGEHEMYDSPQVLLLTGDDRGLHEIEAVLNGCARIHRAETVVQMASLLRSTTVDVLFCDWPFYIAAWESVLEAVRNSSHGLPVIVLTRNGGEREWIDVLESGGFDLLSWPSPRSALLGAIEQASASRDATKIYGPVPDGAFIQRAG